MCQERDLPDLGAPLGRPGLVDRMAGGIYRHGHRHVLDPEMALTIVVSIALPLACLLVPQRHPGSEPLSFVEMSVDAPDQHVGQFATLHFDERGRRGAFLDQLDRADLSERFQRLADLFFGDVFRQVFDHDSHWFVSLRHCDFFPTRHRAATTRGRRSAEASTRRMRASIAFWPAEGWMRCTRLSASTRSSRLSSRSRSFRLASSAGNVWTALSGS